MTAESHCNSLVIRNTVLILQILSGMQIGQMKPRYAHLGTAHKKDQIQSFPVVWHPSSWIGMAQHAWLQSTVWCLSSADLWSILVCALPFTQILITPCTARVVVQCQSDVQSILPEGVTILHNFKNENSGIEPSHLGKAEKTSEEYELKNIYVPWWLKVFCHLLLDHKDAHQRLQCLHS